MGAEGQYVTAYLSLKGLDACNDPGMAMLSREILSSAPLPVHRIYDDAIPQQQPYNPLMAVLGLPGAAVCTRPCQWRSDKRLHPGACAPPA